MLVAQKFRMAAVLLVLSGVVRGEALCGDAQVELPDERALAALERKAAEGSATDQARLGLAYLRGKERGMAERGLAWLKESAAKGDADGEFLLGFHLLSGAKSDSDFAGAVELFRRASSKGCVPALFYLGNLTSRGKGVPKDPKAGVQMMLEAAEGGYVPAQLWISTLFLSGTDVTKDVDEGFRWASKAAQSGNSMAQINLANLYYSGIGAPPSVSRAIEILEVVYKKGDDQAASAAYYLGWIYMQGKGVPLDRARARYWMAIAAKANIMDAKKRLQALSAE